MNPGGQTSWSALVCPPEARLQKLAARDAWLARCAYAHHSAVYPLVMGLLDRIRRGEYVPSEDAVPYGGRVLGLAVVSLRIAAGEETLAAVRDFLDQVGRRTDDELASMIDERPEPTGDARADALLAGIAEHLAATRNLACPGWVQEPERFLDRFWFVSNVPAFRATALAQSPIALKRRGVLWPARSLERV